MPEPALFTTAPIDAPYNFPQGRLTDHRINLTLYKLLNIMEGDLGEVLDALQAAREAELLEELAINA